jgi:hypothetical protein
MIGLSLASVDTVASSLVVGYERSGSDVSCKAYLKVSTRQVELGGRVFSVASSSSEQKEYERGCSHFRGPVVFSDCAAWESIGLINPRRLPAIDPFYTDGTCDGSGGGTRRADAPPLVERPGGLGLAR